MHGIPVAILKISAQKTTPIAVECGYDKGSSDLIGYLETTTNGMSTTKQIVLTLIYISTQKILS